MRRFDRTIVKIGEHVTIGPDYSGGELRDGDRVEVVGFREQANTMEGATLMGNEVFRDGETVLEVEYEVRVYDHATGAPKSYPLLPCEVLECKRAVWVSHRRVSLRLAHHLARKSGDTVLTEVLRAVRVSELHQREAFKKRHAREVKRRLETYRAIEALKVVSIGGAQ